MACTAKRELSSVRPLSLQLSKDSRANATHSLNDLCVRGDGLFESREKRLSESGLSSSLYPVSHCTDATKCKEHSHLPSCYSRPPRYLAKVSEEECGWEACAKLFSSCLMKISKLRHPNKLRTFCQNSVVTIASICDEHDTRFKKIRTTKEKRTLKPRSRVLCEEPAGNAFQAHHDRRGTGVALTRTP